MNWSPVTYPSPARTASRTNSFSAPATPIVGLGIASIHYPSTLVDRRLPATPQPSYLSDSWICAPAQEPSDLAVPKVECKDYLWATNSQDDFVYWSTPFEIEHYQHAVEVFHSHGPMMQQSHVKSQDYHEQRLSHRNKIGHESRSVESHYQQHIPVKQESSLDWTPTSMDNYPTHLSYQDLPSSQVEVLEPAINMSHSLLPPPTNQILPSTAATQTRATPHSSGRQEARQGTRQERLPHFDSEQIQNNSEAPSDTTQGSGSQASRREPKDKRFKCSICGRGFARKFNCTQHEKKHSNERREPSQACHYLNCDKTFGRKTDLDRHINSVHIKHRGYYCPDCHHGFARKDTMIRHQKSPGACPYAKASEMTLREPTTTAGESSSHTEGASSSNDASSQYQTGNMYPTASQNTRNDYYSSYGRR